MKILRIIVNEKPKSCKACLFHGCDFINCDMFGGECPLCESKSMTIDEYKKVGDVNKTIRPTKRK